MAKPNINGHEERIAKLASDFGWLRKWTEDMFFERLTQAELRYRSFEDKLEAQSRLSATIQENSDRAITKAETAQNSYNDFHNDLSRKMEVKDKDYTPIVRFDDFKREFEVYKLAQGREITSLRESRVESKGRTEGISIVWAVFLAIASLAAGFVIHYLK